MIDNQEPGSSTLKERFVGINTFKVLAINPTVEERKAFGFNTDKFTSYFDPDKNQTRIDVVIRREEEKITTVLSFWIQNKLNISSKDPFRSQRVDAHGNISWATDAELSTKKFTRKNKDFNTGEETQVPYFYPETSRVLYVGEDLFTNFLKSWLQVKPTGNCQIPNPEKLFKEDYSELNEIKNSNTVLVPLGISSYEKTNADGSTSIGYSYKAYSKAFTDSWGKAIGSTKNKDLSKNKAEIAKIIQEDSYNKVFFGEHPYEWGAYVPDSSTESTEDKPKNDLPF